MSDKDPINVLQTAAQEAEYRSIHEDFKDLWRRTWQSNWDRLCEIDWSEYKRSVTPPRPRNTWKKAILVGIFKNLVLTLEDNWHYLYYRPESTPSSGSEDGEEPTPSSTSEDGEDAEEETDSDSDSDTDSWDLMETDSYLFESSVEEYEVRGQAILQVNFSKTDDESPCPSLKFGQLGVVYAQEIEKKLEKRRPWRTGYYLAVNLDSKYKPGSVWFLSARNYGAHLYTSRVPRWNTYRPPQWNRHRAPRDWELPRFAAAQIASDLSEMSTVGTSELKFTNIQDEYTILEGLDGGD